MCAYLVLYGGTVGRRSDHPEQQYSATYSSRILWRGAAALALTAGCSELKFSTSAA